MIQRISLFLLLMILFGKGNGKGSPPGGSSGEDRFKALRFEMVDEQIRKRGVRDPRVLHAMESVPRHLFVPKEVIGSAYDDNPLPIGLGQTISQPYIVAYMTEALGLEPKDKVLEIGTGSGYQAAVMSLLVEKVYSIELLEPLGRSAAERLKALGYDNVVVRIGDGYKGWPEEAPFDAIIVTAAPDTIPHPLIDQLSDGGRMVIPVGDRIQELIHVEKRGDTVDYRKIANVRFVPMVSEEEKKKEDD